MMVYSLEKKGSKSVHLVHETLEVFSASDRSITSGGLLAS